MIYVAQIKNAVELQQFISVQDSTLGKLSELYGYAPKVGSWVTLFIVCKDLHVWDDYITSYEGFTHVNINKICSELTKL